MGAVVLSEAAKVAPATGFLSSMWLLVALPLAGSAVLLLAGRRADRWGPYLGCATVLTSFVLGLIYFFQLRGLDAPAVDRHLFSWVPVNSFQVDAGLRFGRLSS